jgi:signal transduction histidine kinase
MNKEQGTDEQVTVFRSDLCSSVPCSLFICSLLLRSKPTAGMPALLHLLRKASRIFYLGIDDTMPFAEVQRTFLFNLFLMIGFPFIIPGIPINFSNGQYWLAYMNCALLVLYTAGVYVNIKRVHLWMRQLIAVLATMVSMTGPVFFRNGTEYNMLINLMSAVILFDNLLFILFSLFIIACVTYVRVRDVNPATITGFAKASPYINIFWSQFLYVLCVYAFKYIYFKYQKQLELAYEKLKQSNESKDRILQIVAHDLRTPVGGISTLSHLLLDDTVRTEEEKKRYLEMIHQSSSQSLNMINELLQGHTNDSGELVKSRINVNSFLYNIAELMQHKAGEKQQSLTLQLPEAPLVIDCDAGKLSRVIHNLVANSIKFTQPGGCIELSTLRNNGQVEISVKDNGIGIPQALRQNLFSMNSQVKRRGTAGEKSFGIGLSVCKQIMEAHGGKIWVSSEEGKGTVFTVGLPGQLV